MLSFGLKTQRGGRGWHDVGTVSAVGQQLRSALCVAPPPERRDLRSVSRLTMSWLHGATLCTIWHMLSEGVLVDVGTFLRVDCYLGSSGKMKGSVSSSTWPGKWLSYRLFKVLTVSKQHRLWTLLLHRSLLWTLSCCSRCWVNFNTRNCGLTADNIALGWS